MIPLPNHAVSGKPAKQQPSGELLDFFTHNYARRALKIEPLIFKGPDYRVHRIVSELRKDELC